MRVAVLSTFPPRQCGIATFSSDLYDAMRAASKNDVVDVIAITNSPDFKIKRPVVGTISQEVRDDYHRGAELVSRLGVDVVLVQHEYGIFGGADGEYLLSFTSDLAVPYAITLHTVLSAPSEHQDQVLRSLCAGAANVLVFTETARRIVLKQKLADPKRVLVVPHGAPPEITALAEREVSPVPMPLWRPGQRSGASTVDRFVLTTFGLLSPGKGLESAIEAVSQLAPDHPELLFVIAGATHPEIVKREGESYRLALAQKVRELDIGDQVIFDDRFLTIAELAQLLGATNLFVTPYRGTEQTVSGALTFAIAAGCPVVSTPYSYAQDLLKDGAGKIVPVDDPDALSGAIRELIESPKKLRKMREAAAEAGHPLSWPAVGKATAAILRKAYIKPSQIGDLPLDNIGLPPLRLDHLSTLMDDAGIIQHATGSIPNRMTGYCVDDVARLAQVASQLYVRTGETKWLVATSRSVSFLLHAADGAQGAELHNFMSYDRLWIGHAHHGDHVGRAIWALGDLVRNRALPVSLRTPIVELLDRLSTGISSSLTPPRVAAYAVLGLAQSGSDECRPKTEPVISTLSKLLERIYDEHRSDDWRWFEETLTYDNARLPQSLLRAGRFLGRDDLIEIGLESLAWLGDHCGLDGGVIRLPGNRWLHANDLFATNGDEQPIDAGALVEAEIEAYRATRDPVHARRAARGFEWFLGRNQLGVPVYDAATGGCRDGLGEESVSMNEGAESTLAYMTARLAMESTELSTARTVIPK